MGAFIACAAGTLILAMLITDLGFIVEPQQWQTRDLGSEEELSIGLLTLACGRLRGSPSAEPHHPWTLS